jgi:hypothetical protein
MTQGFPHIYILNCFSIIINFLRGRLSLDLIVVWMAGQLVGANTALALALTIISNLLGILTVSAF